MKSVYWKQSKKLAIRLLFIEELTPLLQGSTHHLGSTHPDHGLTLEELQFLMVLYLTPMTILGSTHARARVDSLGGHFCILSILCLWPYEVDLCESWG